MDSAQRKLYNWLVKNGEKEEAFNLKYGSKADKESIMKEHSLIIEEIKGLKVISKDAEYQEALAQKKGFKNRTEYKETLKVNRLASLMLALERTGLTHEQAKLVAMRRYSKSAAPYENKTVKKAAQIAATNLNVPLLPGTVQKRRRRLN